MCQSTFLLWPDAGLPLVPDDVRGEGVLDVDVEPEQVLLGVRVEVVVELRRRRHFPPAAKTEGRACVRWDISEVMGDNSIAACEAIFGSGCWVVHSCLPPHHKSRTNFGLVLGVLKNLLNCLPASIARVWPYLMSWQVSSHPTTSRLSHRVGNSLSSTPFFICGRDHFSLILH